MHKPLIHSLLESPMSGEAIEARSFELIERAADEAGAVRHGFSSDQWRIVRRLIHTTGDLGIADQVRFSADAVASAVEALKRRAVIVVDAQMIRAGVSLARLRRLSPDYDAGALHCHIADDDVAAKARASGLPRSLFALREAKSVLDGAIVLFGNAPVGLLELNRLVVEEGVRPALVVGAPVGFVHVVESKEELMTLPVPWVVVTGRRGGSPLAVAALHALCELGTAGGEGKQRGSAGAGVGAASGEAIILLGHGSRVPHAADPMYEAARGLERRAGFGRVEVCFMSRLGPHLPEVFDACVARGARRVMVVPYFLHGGMHLKIDIPELLRECVMRHPQVRVVFADRLGYDERFVEILERRIRGARLFPDIRDVPVEDPDRYPLPAGQEELVAMTPEDAARWREEQRARRPD